MAYVNLHSPDGTTASEVFLLIITSFLSICTAILLSSAIKKRFDIGQIFHFTLEFLLVVFVNILIFTVLADYLYAVLLILMIILPQLIVIDWNNFSLPTHRTDYITNHRALTNILTVIAILAVDFKVFPRRYAKTGAFGYSVMDVGVGLFIFSNGIVAPEARKKQVSLRKSIMDSSLLIIVGLARLFLTTYTSYNVPVSEYGVYWNFFITLAFLRIFASCMLKVFHVQYIYIIASLLIIVHEVLLEYGLAKFVFNNTERTNFIEANKEGLVSLLGYISLYLYSVYFGYMVHCEKENLAIFLRFINYSLLSLLACIVFGFLFGTSRRLANGGYCFWTAFIGCSTLGLLFMTQECIYDRQCMFAPNICNAVNYNGLVFFLIGNLITGLINLSIETNSVSSIFALFIITIYMFINVMVAWILYSKKIKVKI